MPKLVETARIIRDLENAPPASPAAFEYVPGKTITPDTLKFLFQTQPELHQLYQDTLSIIRKDTTVHSSSDTDLVEHSRKVLSIKSRLEQRLEKLAQEQATFGDLSSVQEIEQYLLSSLLEGLQEDSESLENAQEVVLSSERHIASEPKISQTGVLNLEKHGENYWEAFLEAFGIEGSVEQQIGQVFGMIVTDAMGDNWHSPFSHAVRDGAKLSGWKIRTTASGISIDFPSIVSKAPAEVRKLVNERLGLLDNNLEGSYEWYINYTSPDPKVTINHMKKYLWDGTELQEWREGFEDWGEGTLGVDFFPIFGLAVSSYMTWNVDNVYLSDAELTAIESLSIPDLLTRAGVTRLPTLRDFEKLFDFKKVSIRSYSKLSELSDLVHMTPVQLTSLVTSIVITKEDISVQAERDFQELLLNELRGQVIEKAQKKRLGKNGIFPVKEVGEENTGTDDDGNLESNVVFYRKQIAEFVQDLLREELLAHGKDVNEAAIAAKAHEIEFLAFTYYHSQGITAKDDDIAQFSTNKLWRLLATAWYRLKYPGQEGAEEYKGMIRKLILPWTQFASALVPYDAAGNIIQDTDGVNDIHWKAYSLEEIFLNADFLKVAVFNRITKGFRDKYVERGLELANEIYELLKKGMDFNIHDIASYVRTGDLTDIYELVLNQNIIDVKILGVRRSVLGYFADAHNAPPKPTNPFDVDIYHDGFIEVIPGGERTILVNPDPTRSMIEISDWDGFVESVRQMSGKLKPAEQKILLAILLMNHLTKNSGLSFMPDDDIIATVVGLTGNVPVDDNGRPIKSRFQNVRGTPGTETGFNQAEVLGMIGTAIGRRSRQQGIVNAVLSQSQQAR